MKEDCPGRVPSVFERLGFDPPRNVFKNFNQGTMLCWRLGLGKLLNASPDSGGRMMVLGTRGRKSGLMRRTPLNYAPVPDGVCCVAGFGEKTDWYRNCTADPAVEVWLPGGPREGIATTLTESGERLQKLRAVLLASGFASKLFGGIDPRLISDQDLERETADYCVVQIRLGRPVATRVADLAWVWPAAAGGLLLLAALLRRR